jgi:hypothetical protein
MKRCPQCNSVFDDALIYCTNDGTPLIEENFVLPSESSPNDDEEITVIHHDPITVDIPAQTSNQNPPAPTEAFTYQTPPQTNVVPVVIEKPRSSWKNLLFLLIGLILGGVLVLAAVVVGLFLYQSKQTPAANAANRNSPVNSAPTAKSSPSPSPVQPSTKHEKRTAKPDDEFNGRVITANAYVRFLPNKNSTQIDVLPVDDRLNIEERASENSPWYHVTCEHGTTGWMHGNTIEFTP